MCHYCYFLDKGFNIDVLIMMSINDTTTLSITGADYR